jgi:hypothetical protein
MAKTWSIEDPTPEDLEGGTTCAEDYPGAHAVEDSHLEEESA